MQRYILATMASLSLVYVGFLVLICSESALSSRILPGGVDSRNNGVAVKRLIPIRPPKRAVMEPAWTSKKAPEPDFAGFGHEHGVHALDVADNGEPAPPDGSVPRVCNLDVSRLLPLPFDALVHENNVHKHEVHVPRQPPRYADVVHVNNVPTMPLVPVHKHGDYVPRRPFSSADVVHENDVPTTAVVPVHKYGIYVPRRPARSADIVHENAKPSPLRPGNK